MQAMSSPVKLNGSSDLPRDDIDKILLSATKANTFLGDLLGQLHNETVKTGNEAKKRRDWIESLCVRLLSKVVPKESNAIQKHKVFHLKGGTLTAQGIEKFNLAELARDTIELHLLPSLCSVVLLLLDHQTGFQLRRNKSNRFARRIFCPCDGCSRSEVR